MGDIKGRVLEYENKLNRTSAYLYGFGVDKSALKTEHKQWLTATLVTPARTLASGEARIPSTKITAWQIWLCGTASRTGTFAHNLALSKKRAEAVKDYLTAELPRIPHRISTAWSGETLPALKGKRDHREDPLDRAVMISIERMSVPLPSVPVPPTAVSRPTKVSVPCCYWKQEHDFMQAALDAWHFTNGGGAPSGRTAASGRTGASGRTDKLEKPDGQHVQPDRHWFVQLLTKTKDGGGGWTRERANELCDTSHWTNVQMDDTFGVMNRLRTEIDHWDTLKSACSPDDPDEICTKGYLRYK